MRCVVIAASSSGSGVIPTKGYSCNKADGLVCDSMTQKCVALGKEGDACSSDQSGEAGVGDARRFGREGGQ